MEKAAGDPEKFCRFIGQLFDAMATGGEFGLESIRHFNGNLFDSTACPDLTAEEVKRIADTSSGRNSATPTLTRYSGSTLAGSRRSPTSAATGLRKPVPTSRRADANAPACFETFPLPWPPGQEPTTDPRYAAIADAARELVAKRDAWLAGTDPGDKKPRTLTRLYNDRPTWLDLVHRTLDAAVCAAYGWPLRQAQGGRAAPERLREGGPADMSDDQILVRLLALNQERGMTENRD